MISGVKLDGFRGWKVVKLGEMLDPLETKQIHGSNPTKHHQTNKSQKNLGLFLVGIFEIRQEHNKTRLENTEGGANFVRNHSSRYHDVVGWNPRWRSFTNWRGIPKNKRSTKGRTQEKHSRTSPNHTSTRLKDT